MDAFPGNPVNPPAPDNRPAAPSTDPSFEKVVTGELIKRKKPLGKRFTDAFFKGDTQSVGGYVLTEVVVPTIQELLLNVVNATLSRSFGMEIRLNQGFQGIRGGGMVGRPINYNQASQSQIIRNSPVAQPVPIAQRPQATQPSSYELPEVIYEEEINAMELAEQLYAGLEKYQLMRVANLYQMMGQTPTPIDFRFGWDNLDDMRVQRLPGLGYQVVIPRPKPIR